MHTSEMCGTCHGERHVDLAGNEIVLFDELAGLQRSGLEALDAELEGTALFDAAFESGILKEDVGTVLIHVGDTSATVVVADGRRLSSLRAIRA